MNGQIGRYGVCWSGVIRYVFTQENNNDLREAIVTVINLERVIRPFSNNLK